jgi:intraflagellar transport protein 81
LAKFLTPINIPQEFQMDSELMNAHNNYKELQANFAVVHQNLEKMRSEASGPK